MNCHCFEEADRSLWHSFISTVRLCLINFSCHVSVSEFTESLARIYEQHAEEMQLLVSNFRKKNSEFRKEKPASNSSLFHSWETFLQEVEIDSQAHSEIASVLERQV